MSKYAQSILQLFPPGLAWDNNPLLKPIAHIFSVQIQAFEETSKALLLERFTHKQKNSIEEWENALGLNDHCADEKQAEADRSLAIIAKRLSIGGQHEDSYMQVAKLFGYELEIIKPKAFRAGMSAVGSSIGQLPYEIIFKIIDDRKTKRLAGEYRVGTRLAPEQRLNAFVCFLKRKSAAYGKIHFIVE